MAESKDVFNVDAASFAAAHKSLSAMRGVATRTKADLATISSIMGMVAKTQEKMSKAVLVNPQAAGRLDALTKKLEQMGVAQSKIRQMQGKEVVHFEQLGVLERMRLRLQTMFADKQKRVVNYNNQLIELEAKRNVLLSAGQQLVGRVTQKVTGAVRGMTSFATSTAGVELSLMGIVALLLKAYNESNRIGAMSRQAAAQWDASATSLGTASKTMSKLRSEYWMSVDAAGAVVVSMARVGVEENEAYEMGRELVAIEQEHGIAIQESLRYMEQLHEDYDYTSKEASRFLRIAREATKTIPYLSMTEVSQDMMELTQATRSYNSDLLGTLALYETLMRKDVAEKLGLGDAPQAVRKEIVKTVSGFSKELEDGWKAALGEGTTAASRILSFEKMLPPEQFKKMAEFISAKTSGFAADERQIAIRTLLKQFGFASNEVQKVLSEAFVKGGFSGKGLENVLSEINAQRSDLEEISKKDEQNKRQLMQDARKVAAGLTDFEDKLKKAIMNAILASPDFQSIKNNIDKIVPWILQNVPSLFTKLISAINQIITMVRIYTGGSIAAAEDTKYNELMLDVMGKIGARFYELVQGEGIVHGVGSESEMSGLMQSFFKQMRSSGMMEKFATDLESVVPEIVGRPASERAAVAQNMLLSRIRSSESGAPYGAASELDAFISAIVERRMADAQTIFGNQIREKGEIARQLDMYRGKYRELKDAPAGMMLSDQQIRNAVLTLQNPYIK